jgi:hypothetical protein
VHVLRFYAVYRALVRAKVAAIRARQANADLEQAQGYLALAERLIEPPAPRLIITHGVAGCGKSRASRRLLLSDQAAATLRLRSDVERRRLFGIAPRPNSDSRSTEAFMPGGQRTHLPAAARTGTRAARRWLVGDRRRSLPRALPARCLSRAGYAGGSPFLHRRATGHAGAIACPRPPAGWQKATTPPKRLWRSLNNSWCKSNPCLLTNSNPGSKDPTWFRRTGCPA